MISSKLLVNWRGPSLREEYVQPLNTKLRPSYQFKTLRQHFWYTDGSAGRLLEIALQYSAGKLTNQGMTHRLLMPDLAKAQKSLHEEILVILGIGFVELI